MKKEMMHTANFRATVTVMVLSVTVFAIIRKYTK